MSTKIKIWSLRVFVKGIAMRQRTVKNHSFDLTEVPDNGMDPEATEFLCKSALSLVERNMRTLTSEPLLVFTPMEISNDSQFAMKSFQMFDPRQFSISLGSES